MFALVLSGPHIATIFKLLHTLFPDWSEHLKEN